MALKTCLVQAKKKGDWSITIVETTSNVCFKWSLIDYVICQPTRECSGSLTVVLYVT